MPVKAYKAPMMAPAWNWTGLYVGLNAGYGIGRDQTNQTVNLPGPFFITADTLAPAGFVGGGQIGYNWQAAPNWLWGVELDFQGTGQEDSSCTFDCGRTFAGRTLNAAQKLPWFGTARGRLGYVNGDYLWYVTGGGAWANIKSDYSSVVAGGATDTGSSSHTQGGFAAGAGVETHLSGNWTVKFEYLYLDLGSISDSYVAPNSLCGGCSVTVDSKIRDHIVRVGLNYKIMP